jgi:hypothetical protein
MNKIEQHIKSLQNFKNFPIQDSTNKLYFLEVEEKPGMIKPGDTHRDVEERNKETMTNASLHRKKGTKPFFVIAKKWDGSEFRDKEYHSFLKKKGYKFELNDQGRDSEFVEYDPIGKRPTLEQLLEELAEFIRKPVHKTVELRPAQLYILDQFRKAHEEGFQYINAGLCVRVGKTIISLTDSAEQNCMPVYIGKNLTSQSSADKDNAEYGIVPEMLTQSIHGIDEQTDGELSKRTKQIIENIDRANTNSKLISFFIDECDDQSHTEKSRAILKQVVEHYKSKGMFAYIIPMSGSRIHRGMKILKDLTDGAIKEISLEYYEMQILQPETTCNRNYRHISFYSDEADGLANISDSLRNKDTGYKSLATCVVKILSTNNYDIEVNPKFPHWFFKFSAQGKSNVNDWVKFMNKNCSTIENVEYHFQAVNGDFTSNREAEKYAHNIIDKNKGKICVFVTQGMATTSFSVIPLGNSIVFTDNPLTADDNQALHRSATWGEGKPDCNMIVVTTNNSDEFTFDDPFEQETKIATTREEKEQIYRELLNNNSMIHFVDNGKSVRPVKITKGNVADMLDRKQVAMTKVASIMNVVNELDEDIIDDIVNTINGKGSESHKSQSTKGAKFDPFGKGKDDGSDKNGTTNKLTSIEKTKKLREFVERSINIPAVAREQKTTITNFKYWSEIGVPEDLFLKVYKNSTTFKDRIDSIYNLCNDKNYLVENYINKMVS